MMEFTRFFATLFPDGLFPPTSVPYPVANPARHDAAGHVPQPAGRGRARRRAGGAVAKC